MRIGSRLSQPLMLGLAALLAPGARAQVDVLTQHNGNTRSGANRQETTLNTTNVNKDQFGKRCFRLVDGNVYAQPLVVSQAKIANRTAPSNVVIVATESNSVYAFDADDTNQGSTVAQLWHTGPDVLGPSVPSDVLSQAIAGSPGKCVDMTTEIGITSTPVVALTKNSPPKEGVIFVVAKSLQTPGNNYSYNLFALNLADGKPLGAPTLIEGEVKGKGKGAIGPAGDTKIRFEAKIHLNRPGLLLSDNTLYVAFGGHCDLKDFHGWLFAYDVTNPKTPQKLDVFGTTPNATGPTDGEGGIWMSGQGPAVDDAGNIFFAVGNGSNNGTTDFGDSVVKVKLVGGKIQVQDWYAPQNRDLLNKFDVDLGSAGAVLLPDSHLLVAGGKEGRMYLIDRNDMGRGVKRSLHSFQVTHPPLKPDQPDHVYWNIHGSPVVWGRLGHTFVYVCGEEDHLKQYKVIPDTGPGGAGWKFESDLPFAMSRESAPYPNFPGGKFNDSKREPVWMPGGILSLSSDQDKDGTGIVWVTMPLAEDGNLRVVRGILRAYNASNVSMPELWDSEANPADGLGMFAKFCPPTVANGKVYVATFQEEDVLGNNVHQPKAGGNRPALAIYGLK